MENLNFDIYICFAIPLLLAVFVLAKRPRTCFIFILLGLSVCVYCGEVNRFLQNALALGDGTYSVAIAPLNEEICKCVPLLIYFFLAKPDKPKLMEASLLLGIGFATQENAYVLASFSANSSVFLSTVRALGAGTMHIVVLTLAAHVLSLTRNKKRTAVLALLAVLLAVVYHAVFNYIEISNFSFIGYFLPLFTFVPMMIYLKKMQQKDKDPEKKEDPQ